MKNFSRSLFLQLFLVFLLPACSEIPMETDPVNEPVILNKPESGAYISYNDRNWVRTTYLPDIGIIMTFGINDISDFCAQTGGRDWKTYKEIYLPDDDPTLQRIIEQVKGSDITIMLWKPDPWPVARTFCDVLTMLGEPFAMGRGKLKSLDSDVYPYSDGNCRKVASFMVNGKLTGADNIMYHFNYFYHSVWDGVDPSTLKHVTKLDLIPIGKNK
jgi:hypothetical protein